MLPFVCASYRREEKDGAASEWSPTGDPVQHINNPPLRGRIAMLRIDLAHITAHCKAAFSKITQATREVRRALRELRRCLRLVLLISIVVAAIVGMVVVDDPAQLIPDKVIIWAPRS